MESMLSSVCRSIKIEDKFGKKACRFEANFLAVTLSVSERA